MFAPPIKGIRVKAIVQQRRRQIGNGTEDVWTCDAGARGQHWLVDISLPHDIAAATWRGTLKVPGPFSTMATSKRFWGAMPSSLTVYAGWNAQEPHSAVVCARPRYRRVLFPWPKCPGTLPVQG